MSGLIVGTCLVTRHLASRILEVLAEVSGISYGLLIFLDAAVVVEVLVQVHLVLGYLLFVGRSRCSFLSFFLGFFFYVFFLEFGAETVEEVVHAGYFELLELDFADAAEVDDAADALVTCHAARHRRDVLVYVASLRLWTFYPGLVFQYETILGSRTQGP